MQQQTIVATCTVTARLQSTMYMHLLAEDVLARYIALVCVCYSMLCVLK